MSFCCTTSDTDIIMYLRVGKKRVRLGLASDQGRQVRIRVKVDASVRVGVRVFITLSLTFPSPFWSARYVTMIITTQDKTQDTNPKSLAIHLLTTKIFTIFLFFRCISTVQRKFI